MSVRYKVTDKEHYIPAGRIVKSAGRPEKSSLAEHVDVQMLDGLHAILAGVDDHAVSVLQAKVFGDILKSCRDYILTARPTVANLRGALDRVVDAFKNAHPKDVREAAEILLAEADRIRIEDEAACEAIGINGLKLLKPGMGILTHCNAGALATSGYGSNIHGQ